MPTPDRNMKIQTASYAPSKIKMIPGPWEMTKFQAVKRLKRQFMTYNVETIPLYLKIIVGYRNGAYMFSYIFLLFRKNEVAAYNCKYFLTKFGYQR